MAEIDNIKEKRIEMLRIIRKKNKHIQITDMKMISNIKNWMAGRSCPSWDQFVDYCKIYNIDLKASLLFIGYRPDDLSYEGFVGFLLKDFSRQNLEEILGLSASSISKILSYQVKLNLDKIMLLMTHTTRPFSLALSRIIGTKFALRTDSLELEAKYRLIEQKMISRPWVHTLISGASVFSKENKTDAARIFADYFELDANLVVTEIDNLHHAGILELGEDGFYKSAMGRIDFSHFPELGLEYANYFAEHQIKALNKRRGNFGITNTFACSKKTAVRIYQKYAEFEVFAALESKNDENKEVVFQLDHFFWLMFKDFDRHAASSEQARPVQHQEESHQEILQAGEQRIDLLAGNSDLSTAVNQ